VGRSSESVLPGAEWNQIRTDMVPFVTTMGVLMEEMPAVPDDHIGAIDSFTVDIDPDAIIRGVPLVPPAVLRPAIAGDPDVTPGEAVGKAVVRSRKDVVAALRPFIHNRPASSHWRVLDPAVLAAEKGPAWTPSRIRGIVVEFEAGVVRRSIDIEVEPPVGMVAVIAIALEAGTVEPGRDRPVLPEHPTVGQAVPTDLNIGLDTESSQSTARVGIDADRCTASR
jgi:hypothetical protein